METKKKLFLDSTSFSKGVLQAFEVIDTQKHSAEVATLVFYSKIVQKKSLTSLQKNQQRFGESEFTLADALIYWCVIQY